VAIAMTHTVIELWFICVRSGVRVDSPRDEVNEGQIHLGTYLGCQVSMENRRQPMPPCYDYHLLALRCGHEIEHGLNGLLVGHDSGDWCLQSLHALDTLEHQTFGLLVKVIGAPRGVAERPHQVISRRRALHLVELGHSDCGGTGQFALDQYGDIKPGAGATRCLSTLLDT
jgi:hypothetical protein